MGYKELVFPKNSRFLVTGGAGFIGSNICDALIHMGYEVICLDNFSTGKIKNIEELINNNRFKVIKGDICDFETCLKASHGIDYISHQAGWGSIPKSIVLPLEYEKINIKGTLNMMEAARQNNVKKFVYASSSSVYGDSLALPKVEGEEGKILSPYALTKKTNEEYGKLYSVLYDLDTIGLRYFNVFGKRQNPDGSYAAVIPRFIKQLINNEEPIIYGDGMQTRDFTYVDNVIEANLKAMLSDKDASGDVFNIAYGEQIYLIDIYSKLCKLLNKEIKPIFNKERLGDIKHSKANINKAMKLLNYHPEYSFDRGIKIAINWYKENYETN